MIQRKQTLFILAMVVCNCLLLFVPVADVIHQNVSTHIYMVPIAEETPVSTMGHNTAIAMNFLALLLSFAVIFLYSNRKLQIQLLFLLMLVWAVLGLMMWLCPFVERTEDVQGIVMKYLTASISIPAIVSGWFAIKFIQKDINLLKSADRIR